MPYKLQDEELLQRLRRQASDTVVEPTSTPPAPTDTSTSTTTTTTTPTSTSTSSSSTTTSSSTTPTSTSESTTDTTPISAPPTSAPVSTTSNVSTQSETTSMVTTTAVVVTNGSTITTVTATQTIISEGQTSSKSSNVGPIVGGVVGGIGVLAIVIVLFWLIRRRTKKIELDGNIFDPDRNVEQPGRLNGSLDLSEPQMLAHPYNYQAATGAGGAAAAATAGGVAGAGLAGVGASRYSQSQRQSSVAPGELFPHNQQPYGQSPYPPAGGRPQSAYLSQGPVDLSRGPSDGSAYGGMAASSEYPYSGVTSPTSGPHGPSSDGGAPQGAGYLAAFPAGVTQYTPSTTSSAAAKAQQAADARRMHVANDEDGPSGPVVQHQDGGRAPAPQDAPSPPTEVPPAYDSIPRDEPGPSGAGPASASNEAREAAARPEKSPRPLSN